MQTDIDMVTNMAMDIGVKSVYIRALRPREISQSTSLSCIQKLHFSLYPQAPCQKRSSFAKASEAMNHDGKYMFGRSHKVIMACLRGAACTSESGAL